MDVDSQYASFVSAYQRHAVTRIVIQNGARNIVPYKYRSNHVGINLPLFYFDDIFIPRNQGTVEEEKYQTLVATFFSLKLRLPYEKCALMHQVDGQYCIGICYMRGDGLVIGAFSGRDKNWRACFHCAFINHYVHHTLDDAKAEIMCRLFAASIASLVCRSSQKKQNYLRYFDDNIDSDHINNFPVATSKVTIINLDAVEMAHNIARSRLLIKRKQAPHMRGGHIRNLSSGKKCWVRSCAINGGSFDRLHYEVRR